MPKYDYKCKQCNSDFFIICGINDSRENVSCTDCGSTEIARKFKPIILKGTRARGYQDENKEVKQPDNVAVNEPKEENKEVKQADNVAVNEPKTQEVSHTKETQVSHDHCSPELDYK